MIVQRINPGSFDWAISKPRQMKSVVVVRQLNLMQKKHASDELVVICQSLRETVTCWDAIGSWAAKQNHPVQTYMEMNDGGQATLRVRINPKE